ncbi:MULTISPECIES: thiamine-phosphate kinase [Vibrio]|uniref:Thiamine-monophosphate kinase n=1 Tax=Vibrio proteolyticus NBRC 13287 TaxID=1219065 RepID=U3BDS4_VIBPR|nr:MULTISPECIES: thiamine-phosphate kinase [Vibrio]NAW58464.1 thiamine-phosphate kinase [Vibrio sp. V36_P2S2PM302]NAX21708.1 thiamine-phosphate kinase [Vibrio sp. V39_P1S14PM300]NAX24689.1 thiamine-phosphate kinase [Vibrio sp. V38_P2S17PM301]NAX31857.1 thiamine-phosphate kinase [Vibrio sp. V37_P2S8PM304]GAD67879.1 thiamine-monophosphate kinase [Vibrio proteolyticus NBRC 13287]
MSGEFNLIEKYFVGRQSQRKDVLLAAGDDCALVQPPDNVALAISTDTLVEGTHFLKSANPGWVAHKALASNISDLAAMGATPAWVSFALTMPQADEAWLAPFCDAFFQLADYFGIQLIGGDTTKGPLCLTLTVQGFVPKERALTRHTAQVGDWIYVTGDLGDSRAGLDVILDANKRSLPFADKLEERHFISTPRVLAGQALLNIASAAIDISDGLIADLGHILQRSSVGASIDVAELPLSAELLQFLGDTTQAQQYALTSGEEYELCFTVPQEYRGTLDSALAHCGTKITCIGQIRPAGTFELHQGGKPVEWQLHGFDHFKAGK